MTSPVGSLGHPGCHDQGCNQEFTVRSGDGNVYLSSWVSVGQGSCKRFYFEKSLWHICSDCIGMKIVVEREK